MRTFEVGQERVRGWMATIAWMMALAACSAHSATAGTLAFTTSTTGLLDLNIYAVQTSGSSVYAATYGGGVGISTDGGTTWTARTVSNSGLSDDWVYSLIVDGTTLYAGCDGALSISSDNGTSWSNYYQSPNGLASNYVYSLAVAGGKIYAGTSSGLSISSNGGTNFTNSPAPANDDINGLFVAGSTIYAAVSSPNGLVISSDGGSSWTTYNTTSSGVVGNSGTSVVVDGSTIYYGTTSGLSVSQDGGSSWTNYTGFVDNRVRSVSVIDGVMYVGTRAGGLSVSADSGATWENYTTADGLGSNDVYNVVKSGGKLYVATWGGVSVAVIPSPSAVPEIDPAGMSSVFALVGGVLGLLERRRLRVKLS
jgi:hypothetical protein